MKTIRTIGILLLVMSFFIGCEFEIYSENTMEAKGKGVGVMGKIGDIAYSDGSVSEYYDSTKTPIGIVIEVVVGVVTKIVSLTETSAEWSSSWSTNSLYRNATIENNGMLNLLIIQDFDGWEKKYPAFKWCDDYTDESGNSDWYLPAKDELNLVYKAKDVVNAAIEKITAGGGTATKLGTDWYWSSSEYSDSYAWLQSFSDGKQFINYSSSFKDYARSVRAVRAF